MTQEQVLAEVVARTRAVWPDVLKVVLFGSRARGDGRNDSDYDLLADARDALDLARRVLAWVASLFDAPAPPRRPLA